MQSFALTSSVPIVSKNGVASASELGQYQPRDVVCVPASPTRQQPAPCRTLCLCAFPLCLVRPTVRPPCALAAWPPQIVAGSTLSPLAVKLFCSSHPSSCGLDSNIAPIASASINKAQDTAALQGAHRAPPLVVWTPSCLGKDSVACGLAQVPRTLFVITFLF